MQSIKERQLLTAAVAAGVLGLLLLLILLDSNPAIESAQRLQVKAEGDDIVLSGVVERVKGSTNVSFITLKTDTTVVVFGNVSLEKGQKVRVEGRVSSYLGKREIIAERIVNV